MSKVFKERRLRMPSSNYERQFDSDDTESFMEEDDFSSVYEDLYEERSESNISQYNNETSFAEHLPLTKQYQKVLNKSTPRSNKSVKESDKLLKDSKIARLQSSLSLMQESLNQLQYDLIKIKKEERNKSKDEKLREYKKKIKEMEAEKRRELLNRKTVSERKRRTYLEPSVNDSESVLSLDARDITSLNSRSNSLHSSSDAVEKQSKETYVESLKGYIRIKIEDIIRKCKEDDLLTVLQLLTSTEKSLNENLIQEKLKRLMTPPNKTTQTVATEISAPIISPPKITPTRSPPKGKNDSVNVTHDEISTSFSLRADVNDSESESLNSSQMNAQEEDITEKLKLVHERIIQLVRQLANEKKQDASLILTEGDVFGLCQNVYNLLKDKDLYSSSDVLNNIFDVLSMYVKTEFTESRKSDIISDIMDILSTFIVFNRTIKVIEKYTKGNKKLFEQKLATLKERKDKEIAKLLQNRSKSFEALFESESQLNEKEQGELEEEETLFVDEEEDGEDDEEIVENPLLTIDDLLDDEEEIQEPNFKQEEKESKVKVEKKEDNNAIDGDEDQTEQQEGLENVLKELGIFVDTEELQRRMDSEEADLEIQFLTNLPSSNIENTGDELIDPSKFHKVSEKVKETIVFQ
ncbi:hypothetical protein ABK040_009084 [Willaertia magna]